MYGELRGSNSFPQHTLVGCVSGSQSAIKIWDTGCSY